MGVVPRPKEPTVVREDLARMISMRTGYPVKVIDEILAELPAVVAENLALGRRVYFHDMMVLKLKKKMMRPLIAQRKQVEDKIEVHFVKPKFFRKFLKEVRSNLAEFEKGKLLISSKEQE